MEKKDFLVRALKAAMAITVVNEVIVLGMHLLGYDTYPMDPSGAVMGLGQFMLMTFISGGLVTGLIGSVTWLWMHGRWPDRSLVMFGALALGLATMMTLPVTNPNAPTGDAFVLTTVLHYSTALLGIWLIPHFATTGCTHELCPICD